MPAKDCQHRSGQSDGYRIEKRCAFELSIDLHSSGEGGVQCHVSSEEDMEEQRDIRDPQQQEGALVYQAQIGLLDREIANDDRQNGEAEKIAEHICLALQGQEDPEDQHVVKDPRGVYEKKQDKRDSDEIPSAFDRKRKQKGEEEHPRNRYLHRDVEGADVRTQGEHRHCRDRVAEAHQQQRYDI